MVGMVQYKISLLNCEERKRKMIILFIGLILMLILIACFIFINFSPQFGAKTTRFSNERFKRSENYTNGKFTSTEKTAMMTKMGLSTIMKFFLNGGTVPKFSIPIEKNSQIKEDNLTITTDKNVKVIWFGHSAVLLDINSRKIFIDPMLGNVSSPLQLLGPKRFNRDLPIKIKDIPELDAILISHDHYDHLDYWSIIQLKDKVKKFYVPLGVAAHLKSWGIDELKIVELDWWEAAKLEELNFICTPSRHFSGRGLSNRNSTLWCSWVIKGENISIFFSGDTGYNQAFKKVGDKFGPFDLTFLECGQYNEAWADIHMMPEETVQANIDLRGKLLMPIHWGAFKLSVHPWQEPVERLLTKANLLNVEVITPMIGEQVILGKSEPSSRWWDNNSHGQST